MRPPDAAAGATMSWRYRPSTRRPCRSTDSNAPWPVSRRTTGRSDDGEALAPLGAARRQHLAAADRRHARAKTVVAGAADLGGLERAFHGGAYALYRFGKAFH